MRLSLQAVAVAIVLQTLWGANPVAVKLGLLAFPPMWSAFLRFAIGVLCVVVWCKVRGIRLWPRAGEWSGLMQVAALFTVQVLLMNLGLDMTGGAIGSVLIATHPLFAAVFARLFLPDERLSATRIVGLAVAFLGTAIVLWPASDVAALEAGEFGAWVVLLSGGLLGLRLAFGARLLQRIDPAKVAVWQMTLSLVPFLFGAVMFEQIVWTAVDWRPVGALLYQGVVIAGVGFTLNYALMRRYGATTIVSFGFVSPLSGVLLSAWLLGETLDWRLAAGTAAVGLGLILITRPTGRTRRIKG